MKQALETVDHTRQTEFGILLCQWGSIEVRAGDRAAARNAMDRTKDIVSQVNKSPHHDLNIALRTL